jgi:hypothetical protein
MNVPKSKDVLFHPSQFETTPDGNAMQQQRTLATIQKLREQRLTSKTVDQMTSPGHYQLSDADQTIAKSNTKYCFKNLWGETLLTSLFFSDKNVNNIQNLIKFVVHREMGYTVDNQSANELLIVMRSIFLEHTRHPLLIDESMPNEVKQRLYVSYTKEVSRLNDIVVNTVVPKIVSQLQQYLDYLRDASQPQYQTQTPKNDSVSGERQYRSVTQVLFGGNL